MSIQAQVVNLLQDVQKEFGIAFLFIAHDLAVVRHFCPEIAVMYLGKIVEIGDRETLYEHPAPPLHAGAALGRARREAGRRSAAGASGSGSSGDVPEPDQPAVRLPVPHPLLDGPGHLRQGRSRRCCRSARRHKVACHFAGEFGSMPTSPITLSALGVDGQGNTIAGADASTEDFSRAGYADTWTDVATHKKRSDALVGAGGLGTGMSDEQRGEGGTRR